MGSPNADRALRLPSMRKPGQGHVWLAVSDACEHANGTPVRLLLRRFGELYPIEHALFPMRCAECDSQRVSAKLARLCDPECGRQRG